MRGATLPCCFTPSYSFVGVLSSLVQRLRGLGKFQDRGYGGGKGGGRVSSSRFLTFEIDIEHMGRPAAYVEKYYIVPPANAAACASHPVRSQWDHDWREGWRV